MILLQDRQTGGAVEGADALARRLGCERERLS